MGGAYWLVLCRHWQGERGAIMYATRTANAPEETTAVGKAVNQDTLTLEHAPKLQVRLCRFGI
jgi:hypothetical protein